MENEKVNLLPEELKPRGYALKFASPLKKIATVLVVIFLVGLVSVGGAVFVIEVRIGDSEVRQEELKDRIRSLEATEHRLVLIQDRLKKVDTIFNTNNAYGELAVVKNLIENVEDEGMVFDKADLDSAKVEVSFVVDGSANLTKLLTNLLATDDYKQVEMKSLSVGSTTGYTIDLLLVK